MGWGRKFPLSPELQPEDLPAAEDWIWRVRVKQSGPQEGITEPGTPDIGGNFIHCFYNDNSKQLDGEREHNCPDFTNVLGAPPCLKLSVRQPALSDKSGTDFINLLFLLKLCCFPIGNPALALILRDGLCWNCFPSQMCIKNKSLCFTWVCSHLFMATGKVYGVCIGWNGVWSLPHVTVSREDEVHPQRWGLIR